MFLLSLLFFLLTLSPVNATFETADASFEVQKLTGGAMRFIARERGVTVFDHYAATISAPEVANEVCYLRRTEAGTLWNYQGADLSYLTFLVKPQGNIILSSGVQQTNYSLGKSWGFKTPGTLINQQEAAFAVFSSHASQFHNTGILKCLTGDFHHDYYFNKGIMHFGDVTPSIVRQAYTSYPVNQEAKPLYQPYIIDDYGAIIAEAGLKIIGLTHRIHNIGDIQTLTLDNASLDVQGGGLYVHDTVTGTAPRIAVRGGQLHVGSFSPSLHITDWSNTGNVYCDTPSTLRVHGSLDNQQILLGNGHLTIHSSRKPHSLGVIVSNGDIQTIIDEVLAEAEHKAVFGKAALLSRSRRVTIDILKHTDHYLNTITRHHMNGRFTHQIETGYIFQRRTTEKEKKTIEDPTFGIPEELQDLPNHFKAKGLFVQAARDLLKDRLRQLGLSQAQKAGILSALFKGLRDAGLDVNDIQSILDDEEVGAALTGLASYENLSPEGKTKLTTGDRDSNRCIASVIDYTQRLGLNAVEWIRRNPAEAISRFCDVANLLATTTRNPYALAVAGACGGGRLGVSAVRSLNKAHIFYSRRHDEGKRAGGGRISSSSSSSSSTPSAQGPAVAERPFGTYKDAPYHHQKSAGVKSAAPKNGQEVLDSSVAYGTKGHRVGVDPKNKEIVVFMKDGSGTYHGHVRSWEGLEPSMQKALRDAGKVRVLGSGNKIKFIEAE